jgi:hypothetical protein
MDKPYIDDRGLTVVANSESGYSPVCLYCDRYNGYGVKECRAFPSGIPEEIFTGKNKHQFPYSGDRGYQFKLSPITSPEVAKTLDWILPRNK